MLLKNKLDHDSTFYVRSLVKKNKHARGEDNVLVLQHKSEFCKILANKELKIHYQPIVSLSNGKTFGFEALTRGPKESYFHSPEQLFQFAELEGLLYELEKLTRELAIQEANNFIEDNQKIFINISSQVIYDSKFTPGYTLELLQKFNLTSQNVVFEITERNAINDFTAFKQVLEHYRKQGFQIAIDDAGAGYSSLQAISELRPDYIKVDRSLITDIHQNKIKENLLETFVNISSKMDSKIIAEGIETLEELEKVTRLGVHFGQGFFLARPSYPPKITSAEAIKSIAKNKHILNLLGIVSIKNIFEFLAKCEK